MEEFDLIAIGSGAGLRVASKAAVRGMRVALVSLGPLGGTCLNTGCIPSKILIQPADVVRSIQTADRLGIDAKLEGVDFPFIMNRMRSYVSEKRKLLEEMVESSTDIILFKEAAVFTGDLTLEVGGRIITAPRIIIGTGASPMVPPISGLTEAGYLDNISLLAMEKLPKDLVIIGGGYIGCEYAHFFSAMGSRVIILGRSPEILDAEEPEISSTVRKALSRYMEVHTGQDVVSVYLEDGIKIVSAKSRLDGTVRKFEAEEVLVAVGRRPNTDFLKPETTGVKTNAHGWIQVNEYLETTKQGIWAIGDATGRNMFRHTANYEADLVVRNIFDGRQKADFHAVPHAVFTYPEVAAVGMKEAEARDLGLKIMVGMARYSETAMGAAMAEEDSMVKAIVEDGTRRILGCSVAGPEAASLIQQIVFLMNTDHQDMMPMVRSQIIHPTLSEALIRAFAKLRPVDAGKRVAEDIAMSSKAPDHSNKINW